MNLLSYFFIFIFLPLVIILYYQCNRFGKYTLGKSLLTLASLLFYFSYGWKGFIALCLSMIFAYCISNFIFTASFSSSIQKLFLIIAVTINVSALLYCKYLTYFELVLNKYTGSSLCYTAIVVPLGISYFTFSQIAYLVDSYRDNSIKYSLLDYVLFISFFPKISVGPISLTTELIPQFNDTLRKKIDYLALSKGFYRMTIGMAKKLLLADNLASFVNAGYLNVATLGSTNALIVIISYTLQIYFDFSGYCDIALGICTMLGLDVIENFDMPYSALSIAEFWKRWHISLTRFFRNYLYIPLGGNRKGRFRTYLNTMIIFIISGLWHGSATTFIVWGALHGAGSIVSKIISPVTAKLPRVIRWFMTFTFVSFAWVFFRSENISTALELFKQLFTGGLVPIRMDLVAISIPTEGQLLQKILFDFNPDMIYGFDCILLILLIAIALLLSTKCKSTASLIKNFALTKGRLAITVILFVLSVLSISQVTEFIYVNF